MEKLKNVTLAIAVEHLGQSVYIWRKIGGKKEEGKSKQEGQGSEGLYWRREEKKVNVKHFSSDILTKASSRARAIFLYSSTARQ